MFECYSVHIETIVWHSGKIFFSAKGFKNVIH